MLTGSTFSDFLLFLCDKYSHPSKTKILTSDQSTLSTLDLSPTFNRHLTVAQRAVSCCLGNQRYWKHSADIQTEPTQVL